MGLRIGVVTPWAVKCGISSYSRDLTEALAELDVESYIVRLPRFGFKFPEVFNAVAESIPLDKVDLVHVQHEYGLYNNLEGGFYGVLRRLRKPVVTTMHAIGNWSVDRVIAEVSDRVIVHNEFCFRRFAFPEKTSIIPHGCNSVECPPPEEARRLLGIPPEVPVVGYLGFISTYKGLEVLIEAMKEVPKAALLIGGGWHAGPDTSYITNLKNRSMEVLEGRCMWLGFVPDASLPNAYGAMSIVVYPSMFATESGALLTAMGHGKAVIASSLPPFKEKEEVGALMTFEGLEDLREKIRFLLEDDGARSKLKEGARRYVEENSWKNVAEQHLKFYEELLDQAK